MENTVKYKVQTISQLAVSYGVGTKTIRKWLVTAKIIEPGKKRPGYIFTPAEVKQIYDKLGEPGE